MKARRIILDFECFEASGTNEVRFHGTTKNDAPYDVVLQGLDYRSLACAIETLAEKIYRQIRAERVSHRLTLRQVNRAAAEVRNGVQGELDE